MTQPHGPPKYPDPEPAGSGLSYDQAAIEKELLYALEEYRQELGLTPTPNGNQNLATLMGRTFELPRWAIDNLIPEGLTVFAGKPKLGKSWMALDWGLAVAAGGDAMHSYRTDPGSVLYLAFEDSERRMQDRVKKLNGHLLSREALERFEYRTEHAGLTDGGIGQLDQWLTAHQDARLVVIDTFARFRGEVQGRDKYSEDYLAAGALHSLAKKHRIAIVTIHHLRKESAEDWLDRVSGTNGLTAAADTVCGLFRDRGQHDATLRVVGRDIEELDLALTYDDGKWIDHGNAAAYRTTKERREVLEVLEDLGGEGKVGDIAKALSKTVAAVSRLLGALDKENLVYSVKYGVYALKQDKGGTPPKPLELLNSDPPTSTTSITSRGGHRGSEDETTESGIPSFEELDRDYEPDLEDLPDPY